MSLVRLSRLILVTGLACLAAVISGAVYQVIALDTHHAHLQALIALQRDVGALSVGADAIALVGAEGALIEEYEREALRVQSQLAELGRQVPDANVAINAIDLMIADLRTMAERGGSIEMALDGSADGRAFEAFLQQTNIASH